MSDAEIGRAQEIDDSSIEDAEGALNAHRAQVESVFTKMLKTCDVLDGEFFDLPGVENARNEASRLVVQIIDPGEDLNTETVRDWLATVITEVATTHYESRMLDEDHVLEDPEELAYLLVASVMDRACDSLARSARIRETTLEKRIRLVNVVRSGE
jgi:hypothetical protein